MAEIAVLGRHGKANLLSGKLLPEGVQEGHVFGQKVLEIAQDMRYAPESRVVVASEAERAQQYAEIIAAHLGLAGILKNSILGNAHGDQDSWGTVDATRLFEQTSRWPFVVLISHAPVVLDLLIAILGEEKALEVNKQKIDHGQGFLIDIKSWSARVLKP